MNKIYKIIIFNNKLSIIRNNKKLLIASDGFIEIYALKMIIIML